MADRHVPVHWPNLEQSLDLLGYIGLQPPHLMVGSGDVAAVVRLHRLCEIELQKCQGETCLHVGYITACSHAPIPFSGCQDLLHNEAGDS